MGCWNVKLNKFLWNLPAIEEPIRFHKLSPRRRFLAYAREREVILMDPLTGKQSSLGHFSDNPINSLSFSTDDRFLVVSTSDRRIVCFQTDDGNEAWTLTLPGSAASDLFWSKDLNTIACVSRDGFLRTFDIALKQMTSEIRLSVSDPVSIRSSPDEDELFILGLSGSILRVPCGDAAQSSFKISD
jgi:WD40 repeat protein